jgi:repressor LexA
MNQKTTLTKKQTEVLDFITDHFGEHGRPPTYSEIQGHFGFKSKSSVQDYIGYIKKAGFLKVGAQGIELAQVMGPMVQVSVLGDVAAGRPIDVYQDRDEETIGVPQEMASHGKFFALRVVGNSMVEDCIMSGDTIVVRSQKEAKNGETVVALVEGAATVKRYYQKGETIELHPANERMAPILVQGGDFEIQGIVVGLMRSYS